MPYSDPEKRKEYARQWYGAHREKYKQYHYGGDRGTRFKEWYKKYYAEHKEEKVLSHKKWYSEHRTEQLEYKRNYAKQHTEEIKRWNSAYRSAHKEELKEYHKKYYNKEYRQAHREEINAATRRSRSRQDPQKLRDSMKAWRDKNPEKWKLIQWRRRALLKSASGTFTPEQLTDRWTMWGNLCYLCGQPATTTDHVVPLAKGGTNWPANLRPCCGSCNSKKGSKWPYDIETRRWTTGYYTRGGIPWLV